MIAISTLALVFAKVFNVPGIVFAPAGHCTLYGFRYAHNRLQKYKHFSNWQNIFSNVLLLRICNP